MNKKINLCLEWIGAIGVILSILIYPSNVQFAASLGIISNALLGTVAFQHGLYGILTMCFFTTGAHILNLSL